MHAIFMTRQLLKVPASVIITSHLQELAPRRGLAQFEHNCSGRSTMWAADQNVICGINVLSYHLKLSSGHREHRNVNGPERF